MASELLPPVVIGATGGSGTRVMVRVLRDLGMAFGTDLNVSEDAMPFVPLYDRWVDPYVKHWMLERHLSAFARRRLRRALRRTAAAYLGEASPMPGQPWGWKNPRSIHLLPAIEDAFPGLRYVHVVRDPRDMAFSDNQNLLDWHPHLYLLPEEADEPVSVRSALVWHRVNEAAYVYGRSMEDRYLVVRFEDLCLEPEPTIARLAEFAGLPPPSGSALRAAAAEVQAPRSLGRYRRQNPDLLARVGEAIRGDLERFGYDDEAWLMKVHALASRGDAQPG